VIEKILDTATADSWVAEQKRHGLRIGFTCGSFDILHAGHVNLLERARRECDRLMVAVNSDQSVRSYKNPLRPVNPQEERMQVVAGLQAVDAVMLMEDRRPARLMRRWQPHFYIKGGDYQHSGLRSQPLVEAYGGRVILLPFEMESSTSSIIQRVGNILRHANPVPAERKPGPIVFVDRDGTLIENVPYLHDPARVRLLPGVGESLARLQQAGYRIVMVTNQQGIALGYYTIDDFFRVNLELFRQLSPFDVNISRVVFCPHSQAEACTCRKPLPGMIQDVLGLYGADAQGCVMIGDSKVDVQAGEAAGCRSYLVGTDEGSTFSAIVTRILAPV
jgi:rfaE bifunctional protein nucleotidyltransferase chain/domain